MSIREATVRMTVRITFEDNGEDDLKDQARDQLMMDAPSDWDTFLEIEKVMVEPEAKG